MGPWLRKGAKCDGRSSSSPVMQRDTQPRLDRRLRLAIWAAGTRVEGRGRLGPLVFDREVWAGRPKEVRGFDVSDAKGLRLTAEESYIVRAFRVRQNGLAEPEVPPYPAGMAFLTVDTEGRVRFVLAVAEIGRRRYLELTVKGLARGSDVSSSVNGGTFTFEDGFTSGG